jgi:hypothetical protein
MLQTDVKNVNEMGDGVYRLSEERNGVDEFEFDIINVVSPNPRFDKTVVN